MTNGAPDLATERPQWPRVLIFDANVYLDLAKIPGNAGVLRAIERAVRKGTAFTLAIPEPVKTAVDQNRTNAIEAHWKLRRDTVQSAKLYVSDLAPDAEAFRASLDAITKAIDRAQTSLPDAVAAMESLLSAGVFLRCEDRHHAEAGRRFVTKRAPAQERSAKKRKHISIYIDCLIWAIVKEEASSRLVEFVTGDTDFTSPTNNQQLHEDLAAEVKGQLKFHTLPDFLRTHITDAPAVVPRPSPIWEGFKVCPICGSDKIGVLVPGPSQGGWSYRQYCAGHRGYVDSGEPYDD